MFALRHLLVVASFDGCPRFVAHDHKAFLAKARVSIGFTEEYDALELEYQVANQMLKARSRAGLIGNRGHPLFG